MKRWTIKVVVFLLLGAIVNVAVAWGCAAVGRHQLGGYSGISLPNLAWERSILLDRS